MFLSRRPSPKQVAAFIAESRELPLSYDPIGLADQDRVWFKVDERTAIVGHGKEAFGRARLALGRWSHFDLGWVEVFPKSARLGYPVTRVLQARFRRDSASALARAVAD